MINPIRLSLSIAGIAIVCFGFKNARKETITAVSPAPIHKTISIDKATNSTYKLVIKKGAYEMTIFDEEGWYGTYPVVFGNKSQEDKKMEGDRLTPEGHFKIVGKKIHSKWGKFLMLDYPTQESKERFNARKAAGQLPQKATIGGGIGIHGTRPSEEWVVDKFINWTSGCISVKYSDMDELYEMLPIGTEVVIEK